MSNTAPSRRAITALAAATMLTAGAASAQSWPERPITMIVPWGAGGGTDTLARAFAAQLEGELGQPINVVNRTGAGGVVGHTAMAVAQPDGYTLGLGTVEFTTYAPLGQSEMTNDDYTLICRLASLPAGITVRADSEFEDASDVLEAIVNAEPGTYSASGSGVGGAWHLSVAGWLNAEGHDPLLVNFIPSQGGAPALTDVVAGGTTMYTGSVTEGRALADAGEVKLLAIMHPDRIDALPDVPTIAESTGTDWASASWFSFMAPAGLDQEITDQLIESAQTVMASEEFSSFVDGRGFVAAGECGDEFTAFADQVAEDTATVLQRLGLAAE